MFSLTRFHNPTNPEPDWDAGREREEIRGEMQRDLAKGDKKPQTRNSFYWPLFEHMSNHHGLTLLDSELEDIVQVVKQLSGSRKTKTLTRNQNRRQPVAGGDAAAGKI